MTQRWTPAEKPVDGAQAVLLHREAFTDAENRYDAVSNGNFDQVVVTSAHGDDGDLYVFEHQDGGAGRRLPPCRWASLDAAKAEAVKHAVTLLETLQLPHDASGWLVRIFDSEGRALCEIDAAEAIAARTNEQ